MKVKERKKAARPRRRTEQDVTYIPAKPFNRNRFLLQLGIVASVVLALLLGLSIFFNVDTQKGVMVSGTVKYDPYDIMIGSGITEGENLITLNKNRVAARILEEFPYVATVRIDKRLPDSVVIHITELEVVYAIADQDNQWWLMSAAGKVVESVSQVKASEHTQITGFVLSAPKVGQQAVAYEPAQQPDAEGNTVPVTVYAADRLRVTLEILQNLERESFMGSIAQVDVTNLSDIQLWYSNRFQMLLGDSTDLPKKINALHQAMDLKEDYETGILDASFTIWPDQVGHSQFP